MRFERPHQETERLLREAAERHQACLVAFSGGKDSLAVLDLCSRAFSRVEAFCMIFVPGLRCLEVELEYARQRWGIIIHEYPHWLTMKCLAQGIYCWGKGADPHDWTGVNAITQRDIYELAARDTGIPLVATGQRRNDYLFRAANAKRGAKTTSFETLLPVVGWNTYDVLAYLKAQQIPLPERQGKRTTGIDLSTPSLLWLYDNHPHDFETLEKVFPFARAAVYRRDWYGIE